MPTAAELGRFLAAECGLEWHELLPLASIASYYEFLFNRNSLNEVIRKIIANPSIQPGQTMVTLVEMIAILQELGVFTLVITTNYDQHFEQAYMQRFGMLPDIVIYQSASDPSDRAKLLNVSMDGSLPVHPDYWLPKKPTLLYKLHGCVSQPANQGLVITEEDYINSLTNITSLDNGKRILNFVRGQLALSSIVFLGYSLEDWNFRVLYKGLEGDERNRSYAIQYREIDGMGGIAQARWRALTDLWDKKRIDIINARASDFLGDLIGLLPGPA